MDLLSDVITYFRDNPERVRDAVQVHLKLSLYALGLAILLFAPLGVLAARARRVGPPLVGLVGAARVVPSLAVLFLLLPTMGTGFRPALVALTILAGPPIVINTEAALRGIDRAVIENARGLGMTAAQVFRKIEFPLGLPVFLTGVRTATVEVIASATLAAFIGAGGLGNFIISGITLVDDRLLLVGALPIIALTLLAEVLLTGLERLVTPPTA
jgi:osmoprotectant transport system permease protein